MAQAALRLTVDTAALVTNWRWLSATGGVAAGAAVKADAYGLGARLVVDTLAAAGARDFFVASWAEAAALGPMPDGTRLAVLHGLQDGETPLPGVVPVLNTADQVARWVAGGGGACDLMIDTGMNRLGLSAAEAASLSAGLQVDVVHSHLACADDAAHPLNGEQLARFRAVLATLPHKRASLANSAGTCHGPAFGFDLTRPGISLYGGVVHPAAAGHIRAVVGLEARVVQVRQIEAGQTVGYGATWSAPRASRIAVLNLGYADGYRQALAGHGAVRAGDTECPLVGRVSMDLIAADVTQADVAEGDLLRVGYDLPALAAASGISQYELLTGLGHRYARAFQ